MTRVRDGYRHGGHSEKWHLHQLEFVHTHCIIRSNIVGDPITPQRNSSEVVWVDCQFCALRPVLCVPGGRHSAA